MYTNYVLIDKLKKATEKRMYWGLLETEKPLQDLHKTAKSHQISAKTEVKAPTKLW